MPDRTTLEEMRDRIDRLSDETDALRELGEREGLPAIERNAARLSGVIEQLSRNLPSELLDE